MSADDDRQWLLRRVSGATVRRMSWCVAPPEKYWEPGNKPPVVESELRPLCVPESVPVNRL